MLQCPKEVLHVFDNEGETVDRYSIVILYEDGESYVVTSSQNPTHPLGVWSSEEGYISASELTEEDKHIGKEIFWEDLPTSVQSLLCSYFYNLTFEANDLELIKLDDMERENHDFCGIYTMTLNKEDGEAFYLPNGFYRIANTEEYFLIRTDDNREFGGSISKSLSVKLQTKNSLFESISQIREEKEQVLIDAHKKRINDEIENFKSKIGSELKFDGDYAEIEDLFFKKLKVFRTEYGDYDLYVDDKCEAEIHIYKNDESDELTYSCHDGAEGYGWHKTIHEAIKSYMEYNYRYPNHDGEYDEDYEIRCTFCGDGGCIHCEPHRFL